MEIFQVFVTMFLKSSAADLLYVGKALYTRTDGEDCDESVYIPIYMQCLKIQMLKVIRPSQWYAQREDECEVSKE